MRRTDALSLARTLMAAGARVQDRPALVPDTRDGLGVAASGTDWPETAPRTLTPVRFGPCAAFRDGSQVVHVGASHTFR
jgi:hypothetical protein